MSNAKEREKWKKDERILLSLSYFLIHFLSSFSRFYLSLAFFLIYSYSFKKAFTDSEKHMKWFLKEYLQIMSFQKKHFTESTVFIKSTPYAKTLKWSGWSNHVDAISLYNALNFYAMMRTYTMTAL